MNDVQSFIDGLERKRISPGWYSGDYRVLFERDMSGWHWDLEDTCFDNTDSYDFHHGMLVHGELVANGDIQMRGFPTRAEAAGVATDHLKQWFGINLDVSGFRVYYGRMYIGNHSGYSLMFWSESRAGWTVRRSQSVGGTTTEEELNGATGCFGPCYINQPVPLRTLREAVECYLNAG